MSPAAGPPGPPGGPPSGQPQPPSYQPPPIPPAGGQGRPDQAPAPWLPPNASNTPNAERYLLEADALRRRQLRSALLHGSSRTWREHRRIWPGVASGIVVVAVILATFAVIKALDQQEEADQEQEGLPVVTSTVAAPTGQPTTQSTPAVRSAEASDTIVR